MRYHDEIHGDVFTQVNRTLEIMQAKYLKAAISYDGVQRVETWPVPSTALREALLNGVSHKDYSSNVPLQISVYHDNLLSDTVWKILFKESDSDSIVQIALRALRTASS